MAYMFQILDQSLQHLVDLDALSILKLNQLEKYENFNWIIFQFEEIAELVKNFEQMNSVEYLLLPLQYQKKLLE